MDSRLKPSIKEPSDIELKILLEHLEHAFLEEESKLLVIITVGLANEQNKKIIGGFMEA